MCEYKIIVATDSKGGIGKDNKHPWNYPEDLKYFSKTTIGDGYNCVIMGRKTWESLPIRYRPLPKRRNYVLSRRKIYETEEEEFYFFPNEQRSFFHNFYKICWVIGGEQIYKLYLPDVTHIYLTKIPGDYNCDTFFNMKYLNENFVLEKETKEGELNFCVYKRIE